MLLRAVPLTFTLSITAFRKWTDGICFCWLTATSLFISSCNGNQWECYSHWFPFRSYPLCVSPCKLHFRLSGVTLLKQHSRLNSWTVSRTVNVVKLKQVLEFFCSVSHKRIGRVFEERLPLGKAWLNLTSLVFSREIIHWEALCPDQQNFSRFVPESWSKETESTLSRSVMSVWRRHH